MTGQRAGRFAALPFSALHFNVRISGAGMPGGDLGFSEVVFPPFPVSSSAEAAQRVASDPALDPPAAAQNLVLRRGFDGRLDLYRWWDQARKRRALRGRTVTVQLLDAQGREPVVTWRFGNARPLLLAYSPLDALHGGVLMETLTLAFETMSLR